MRLDKYSIYILIIVAIVGTVILVGSISNSDLAGEAVKKVETKASIDFYTPAFYLIDSLISKSPYEKEINNNKNKLISLKSDIIFKNVSFSYDEKHLVLDNLNLTIPKGKITAIVGESGSGKSTIADLLLGLYIPEAGKIHFNGIDPNSFYSMSWRNIIGFVSQDNFLFHDTIMENIRIGHLDSTDEMVIKAAKMANAHKFITNLPNGYDTVVGDRGMLLSGGQKQRISIARVLLRDPEIIVFDEATSALDYETEMEIQKEIFNISHGKTVLIISHRLETIKDADVIYKIKDRKATKVIFSEIKNGR